MITTSQEGRGKDRIVGQISRVIHLSRSHSLLSKTRKNGAIQAISDQLLPLGYWKDTEQVTNTAKKLLKQSSRIIKYPKKVKRRHISF